MDNIYVINMDRSSDRLKRMKQQIPKLGKEFIRISAVDGSKLSKKTIIDASTWLCSNFCTASMIGCFLSHRKAWEEMLKNDDQYALIMEDDCELVDTFKTDAELVINELKPLKPDLIYLGCFGACNYERKYDLFGYFTKIFGKNQGSSEDHLDLKFSYVPEVALGTHCYIISKACAMKLLEQLPLAKFHVDITMHLQKVNVFASKKILAIQNSSAEQSTQSVYKFPVTANALLDNLSKNQPISYSFYFSSPHLEILGTPVNLYLLLFILVSILTTGYVAVIFLLMELIINPMNYPIILRWYLIYLCIYALK